MNAQTRESSIRTRSGAALGTEPATPVAIDSLLPGSWLDNEAGRCFVAQQTYDLTYIHGLEQLDRFLSLDTRSLARLLRDPILESVDLRSALFLDTETTGLDRNSGTLVFLVGVGYFRDGHFEVRQFFMDGPASERAMLRSLCELLQEFKFLVTFNGKGFDVPMLETRFAMCGISYALRSLIHADMLFPARRLWKLRLQSCRLGSLEQRILGLSRTGDVAGSEIPGLYFRYCDDGDTRGLLPVFYHNAQDLLTLLAITTQAVGVYHDPFGGRVQSGLDFMSLGRAYEAAGDEDRALIAYDRALSLSPPPSVRAEVCKRITPLYKRRSQLTHAVALWEQMVTSEHTQGVHPFRELAKYYEHNERRYDRAEELLLRALELLPRDCCTHTTREDLEKRLKRVRAKLKVSTG